MEITNINQLDPNGTYTYADYLVWKFKERVELLRGRVLKMSPASASSHQKIAGNLYFSLRKYFQNSNCELFFAPFDVRLPKKNGEILSVVQPDLCVICDLSKLDEKGCLGAPDLVVEILSPGNSKKEMKLKYDLYQENGVKEYWVVIPDQRYVQIFVLEEGNYVGKHPIVDKEYKLVGLITIKDIDNQLEYPQSNKDDKGRLIVGAGVGVGEDTMDRVKALVEAGVDIIAVDSAHGHSRGVLDKVSEIRKNFPNLDIVGGNIVTAEAAKDLIEAGANILKVGVGPGSICTTRVVAGVGVPQLSAIYNVFEFAKTKNVAVIADGGIKLSGDIVKAIASGAGAVMLGSLLAGTDEAPGEEIIFQGRKFKSYQGMGSLAAMKRGGKERYFQSEAKKFVPEGIEGRVPHKGKLEDVVFQLTGGIRAGMGYCGAKDIETLQNESKMVMITGSGLKESHPHDVIITQEAPNYSL
jgi:IMP dehydrogenase/GMP reductase/Uma2 family endonuclease